MPDVDEPFIYGVPLPVEVLVTALQLREGVLWEPSRSGFVLGTLVDKEGYRGVEGREKCLRSHAILGGIGALASEPEGRTLK